MPTSIEEMRWVLRAQVGDREALELLLRSVMPTLRRYLSGLAGAAEADDLLQDVLIIVVRKLGSLEDPQVFRPWTFRIASREAFRHLKKRRVWIGQHEEDMNLDAFPMPETLAAGELLQQLLAVDAISPASRAVLLLLTFIVGAQAAHADGGMVQAVLAHFFMLIIWVTALTLVVIIQINAMTKRILRAIELGSRK